MSGLGHLLAEIRETRAMRHVGRIASTDQNTAVLTGLGGHASVGDLVRFAPSGSGRRGEVIAVGRDDLTVLCEAGAKGLRVGDRAILEGSPLLYPCKAWIGRILDPFGGPLDGAPLKRGGIPRTIYGDPPAPMGRKRLGARMETGLRLFNTILTIVKGQRIGLFAGSGVGKTTLLAKLARGIDAEIVVIALVGERGREVREFVERALGPAGLARSVVVAATSDRSPLERKRCLPAAVTIAEHFRDEGANVLLIADSVTRFAEAHREIALAAGEPATLGGHPASMVSAVTQLTERTGPGASGTGDISAIFSVLVAGSDMEGAVADTLRGVLDGHFVLDREIAERGRFPAVDVSRSVSRALPEAASEEENALIADARGMLTAYERAELMIQSGLYAAGSDPLVDRAMQVRPALERFFTQSEALDTHESFRALGGCLSPATAADTGENAGHGG